MSDIVSDSKYNPVGYRAKKYARLMKKGGVFPPIEIARIKHNAPDTPKSWIGKKYYILNGYARYFANRRLRKRKIRAIVVKI